MRNYTILLWLLSLLWGCKKEKLNPPKTINTIAEYSDHRIINLGNYRHVIVNNDTLTYMDNRFLLSPGSTIDFPDFGALEKYWKVPKRIFQDKNNLNFKLFDRFMQNSVDFNIPIAAKNMKSDYFVLPSVGIGQNWVVPVEREESTITNPGHFKIRVVNLMKTLPNIQYVPRYGGGLINLNSPVTLTFADGTPVSHLTSNVDLNMRVSEYVELPYGTYQFKIFNASGDEISAGPNGVVDYEKRYLNPSTSQMEFLDGTGISTNVYAPSLFYGQGGHYTIVLAPQEFTYRAINNFTDWFQNQFLVLEDKKPEVNSHFFKVQGINASEEKVRFRIGQKLLRNAQGFAEYSESEIMPVKDKVFCEVINMQGEILANTYVPVKAHQHLSLWYWVDDKGKGYVVPVFNNLDNQIPFQRYDDYGGVNRLELTHGLVLRFLNFSPDVSSLNYTLDIGSNIPEIFDYKYIPFNQEAFSNILKGEAKTLNPYLYWDDTQAQISTNNFKFLAFSNSNDKYPGNYLENVVPLENSAFVANPFIYQRNNREIPAFESGNYSIALVGSLADNAKNPAKIIAIKHTK